MRGPDLDINVDTYVKKWIWWKEQNEEVREIVKENPSEKSEFADEIFTTERAMNSCAVKMRASKNFGYWRICFCEDGSRRFV